MNICDKVVVINLLLNKTCNSCVRNDYSQRIMKQCSKIEQADEVDPIPTCDFYVGKNINKI